MAAEAREVVDGLDEAGGTGDAAEGLSGEAGFESATRGNGGGMTITQAPEVADDGTGSEDGARTDGGPEEPDDAGARAGTHRTAEWLGPVQTAEDSHGIDPAYALEPDPAPARAGAPDGTPVASVDGTDTAYLVEETGPDGPPVETAPAGSLAAVVADHLAGPAPDGGITGSRAEAAEAVLDVLRAGGWSDTVETAALRAEVERLRELLDLVVRDHRARIAVAANGQDEQAHWLVPLLRAAHGVAFGTLGAKVHLRTAVQHVPADMLASAGLRIDDSGPPPETDDRG